MYQTSVELLCLARHSLVSDRVRHILLLRPQDILQRRKPNQSDLKYLGQSHKARTPESTYYSTIVESLKNVPDQYFVQ